MDSLRRLAGETAELFEEIHLVVEEFAARAGFRCPEECGACCEYPDLAVTVLDMLPAAMDLWQRGQAEGMLASLGGSPEGTCPFYEGQGGRGRCLNYEWRPSLCRLYGFAGLRDQQGLVQIALCRVQRQRGAQPEGEAPAFSDFARRLAAIDPGLGTRLVPIRRALGMALEKVITAGAYEREVASKSQ